MTSRARTYVVEKGKRDFRPLDGFMPIRLSDGYSEVWEVVFSDSCRYNIGMPDQLDWNKGGGISLRMFGREHSGRWVWRYAPEADLIELSAYYYIDGVRMVATNDAGNEVLAKVKIAECACVEMWRNGDDLVVKMPNGYEYQKCMPDWPVIGREMGLFFGGSQKAPQRMELMLNRIKIT